MFRRSSTPAISNISVLCKSGNAVVSDATSGSDSDTIEEVTCNIRRCVIRTVSGNVSVFEAGSAGDLPAIVLLPGWVCSAHRLLQAFQPLAEKTKLIAVEWRGHGSSDASKNCVIKDLASDAMSVIRTRLQGSRICIVGHSVGVRVLWHMMDAFKEELNPVLEGVAMMDQDPSPTTSKIQQERHPAHALLKRQNQSICHGKKQLLSYLQMAWGDIKSGLVHSHAEMDKWMAFAGECDPATAASIQLDALEADYMHVVQSMSAKIPVLLVIGDATLGREKIYERMSRATPQHGAHAAVFPGGTHCLHHQHEHLPRLMSLVEQLLCGTLKANRFQERKGGMSLQHKPRNMSLTSRSAGNGATSARLPLTHGVSPRASGGIAGSFRVGTNMPGSTSRNHFLQCCPLANAPSMVTCA
jgi:pimeloyl-ACP methyl ester carboxylesterase